MKLRFYPLYLGRENFGLSRLKEKKKKNIVRQKLLMRYAGSGCVGDEVADAQ